MSKAYQVIKVGTDSSGRPIFMNRRMKAAFDEVVRRCGFHITIVQGAYMRRVGGGATASAGTHDGGACIDTRTWDLTASQQHQVIHVARSVGWAVWKRDSHHGGFEEHMHWVLLGDEDATADAKAQMTDYRNGGDGLWPLTGNDDYHWRPSPIPSFNYKKWLEAHDMPSVNDLLSAKLNPKNAKSETVRSALNKGADALAAVKGLATAFDAFRGNLADRDKALDAELGKFRENSAKRDKALKELLEAVQQLAIGTATAAQVEQARQSLEAAIAAD